MKTFNWITLTREDATRSVSSWRRHPRFLDFFAGYPDASNLDRGQCQEEYWFHSAIFGVFNTSSAATATANTAGGGMLTYPSAMEQGRCFMYTWWEGYPPNSQFRADNIPELGYKHTKGKFLPIVIRYVDMNFLGPKILSYKFCLFMYITVHFRGQTSTLYILPYLFFDCYKCAIQNI